MATPRLAESGSRRLADSPSRGVSDSPISRVGESPTLWLAKFFFWTFKSRLPDSASRWVVDSPTCRVGESVTPRLAESESCRLPDSASQGVVYRLRISPRIRSQKQNGSKSSVRDVWGPNFCKNPRKSASLPCPFKGAQVWDFRSLGFSWFLHHKFSMGGRLWGLKIFYIKIFRGSFGAANFLTRIWRRYYFWVWVKNNFSGSFIDQLLLSKAIFENFCCFRDLKKNYQKNWIPYAHALTFMRTLSIRVRNLRACWACASGTDAFTKHTSQELVRALSIRIRY